eukprot:486329-Pyramimonas_sp.AAC.1
MLCGGEVWPVMRKAEHRIACVQRRMLRQIRGTRRRVIARAHYDAHSSGSSCADIDSDPMSESVSVSSDTSRAARMESWPDFIKRATQVVEVQLQASSVESWAHQQRRRKWQW